MIGKNRFSSHPENSCLAVDNPSKSRSVNSTRRNPTISVYFARPWSACSESSGSQEFAVMDKSLYITYVETCWTLFFWAMLGRQGRRSADAANTVRHSFVEEHRKRANGYRDREMV